MNAEVLLSREQARGDSFKLLSECYHLPSRELTQKLEELRQQVSSLSTEAALYVQRMKEDFEGLDLEALRLDFAKLFVGPYKLLAPPYGSVYLDGERKVMGDSTIDVWNWYREAGLDTSNDFKNPPDHVAAELEFMYFLVFKEIEAIASSDLKDTLDCLSKQRLFLQEHLGAWISEFADHLETNAETEFYKNLARATKAFIKRDLEELSGLPHREIARRQGVGAVSER